MPSPCTITPSRANLWAGSLPPSYSCPKARSTSKPIGQQSSTLLHLELEYALIQKLAKIHQLHFTAVVVDPVVVVNDDDVTIG